MASSPGFPARLSAPLAPWLRAVLCGVGVWAAAPAALAQAPPCDSLLASAEERYVGRAFAEAEGLARACLAEPGHSEAEALRAYRLLALVFLRQDDLPEARQAVVRLLGVSFAYEPDPVQDPPAYVALVASVKEQLHVAQAVPDSARAVPPVAEPEVEIVRRPVPEESEGPEPARVAARPRSGLTRWLLIGGGVLAAGTLGVLLLGGDSGSAPPGGAPLPPPPAFPR